MAPAQLRRRARHPVGLGGVRRAGHAGPDAAEGAPPRAAIPQQDHGGGPRPPALPHVGAQGVAAHRPQAVPPQDAGHLRRLVAGGHPDLEPFRTPRPGVQRDPSQAPGAGGRDRLADRVHRGGASLFLGDRGGFPPFEAAEVDPAEVGEVGRHVQREAVVGDPLPDADADRGDLPLARPHSRQPRDGMGPDAEPGQGIDQRGLDGPDEPVHVGPLHPDDRVADELPRPVVGDVAAPSHPLQRDPFRSERFPGHQQVRLVAAAAERVDVRVREEEERVGDPPVRAALQVVQLDVERVPVPHLAEPHRFQGASPALTRNLPPRGSRGPGTGSRFPPRRR